MIVVTGAAGFIGSCLIGRLNAANFNAVVAVDDFSRADKAANLHGKRIVARVPRDELFDWLDQHQQETEFIFHLGARTDTTEFDPAVFDRLNVGYSKRVWEACCRYQLPLVYASSAATYGLGEAGYDDDEARLDELRPLNPYGESKLQFDRWASTQSEKPLFWAGLN
ncbi:MAG: NAD-dependent epimerase/dehydratase family protein, partial [Catalinimonas sp.]